MTIRQAALTSMREYALRLKGHNDRQQAEWERSRWVAFSVFSPFVKRGPKTPEQWCRFPWEKSKQTRKAVKIDDETVAALNEIYADFMARKNNVN